MFQNSKVLYLINFKYKPHSIFVFYNIDFSQWFGFAPKILFDMGHDSCNCKTIIYMPCIELDSALSFISNLYINKISYNSHLQKYEY